MAKTSAEPAAGRSKTAEKPSDEESLATAIRNISDGVSRLKRSGLNRDAVVVLLHDQTRVSKKTINSVIDGLSELERRFCR